MSRPQRYVEGAALISGFPAHVLDRLLARYLPALLSGPMPAELREDLEAARAAIARAADVYLTCPVSGETPEAEIAGSSSSDEARWVTAREAAALLGMTPRRARQLAAGGMGVRSSRGWLLDRAQVLAYRSGRRSA